MRARKIDTLVSFFQKEPTDLFKYFFSLHRLEMVDLSKCKKGDILISTHGAKLEYIAPTPWKQYTYLDHVVRYIKDSDGSSFGKNNYGTRTNDGFVFANNRDPELDHDIAKIIKRKS